MVPIGSPRNRALYQTRSAEVYQSPPPRRADQVPPLLQTPYEESEAVKYIVHRRPQIPQLVVARTGPMKDGGRDWTSAQVEPDGNCIFDGTSVGKWMVLLRIAHRASFHQIMSRRNGSRPKRQLHAGTNN